MSQENIQGSGAAVRADERIDDLSLISDADADADDDAERNWPKAVGAILHWLLPIVALAAVGVVGWRDIRHLDLAEVHRSFQAISLGVTVALLLAGLATASLNTLYDLLLRRWLALEIRVKELVRIAWVASALNNVVGFSGMTGSGVRYLGLTKAGVAPPKAVGSAALVVLSMPLGLSVLATTLLAVHREMLQWTAVPAPLGLAVLGAVSLYWPLFVLIAGHGPLHRRWLADTPTLGAAQRVKSGAGLDPGLGRGRRAPLAVLERGRRHPSADHAADGLCPCHDPGSGQPSPRRPGCLRRGHAAHPGPHRR